MSVSIEYKGWRFTFETLPTSAEIEARYEASVKSQQLTMPVPTPKKLEREEGPYTATELEGRRVVFHPASRGPVAPVVGELLREGAVVGLPRGASFEVPDGVAGSTFTSDDGSDQKCHALVFDLRRVGPDDAVLDELFDFVHTRIGTLETSGRLIVLGRAARHAQQPSEAAVWAAVDGFIRALAREVGIRGVTANRVEVQPGADDRVGPVLRFLLSPRAAYVDGQVLRVTSRGGPISRRPAQRVLEGKTALITGAARGIGKETATQFSREGASVIWIDLPSDNRYGLPGSEKVLASLEKAHGGTHHLIDVAADGAVEQMVEMVRENGGIDILVNNAAVVQDSMFMNMTQDRWSTVLGVNLRAPFRLTDALLSENLIHEHGRVLFVSSVAGIAGNAAQVNYSTSKAGLLGLVSHYAERVGKGITVNAVATGPTDTVLFQRAPEWMKHIGIRLNALSQIGHPRDTANLLTFLAMPDAQGITGEWIRCCGAALPGA